MNELVFIYTHNEPISEQHPLFKKVVDSILEMFNIKNKDDVFYYRHDNQVTFYVKRTNADKYLTELENNIKENDPMYKVVTGAYPTKKCEHEFKKNMYGGKCIKCGKSNVEIIREK